MDQQDAVVAHLNRLDRRMTRIGGAALGLLAVGLFAAMGFQDPETVAVQNIVRTQRLELTNAEGKVVAVLTAVAQDPEVLTTYYDNGLRRRRFSVQDNQWDGPYVSWASNGLKIEEGQFKNGKRHGAWKYWHTGGNSFDHHSVLAREETYLDGGVRDGTWTNWHDNGKLERVAGYDRGARVGVWTSWHWNGVKLREGRYDQGKEVGVWTWWHDNGQKSFEGHYENGKSMGVWRRWWPDGSQKEVGEHLDGEEIGIWQRWYENGQKAWEGEYLASKMNGTWTFWNEDGSIDEELTGSYENDVRIR